MPRARVSDLAGLPKHLEAVDVHDGVHEAAGLEAYVLAGELERARSGDRCDHRAAFAEYERRLRPFVAAKQKSAPKNAGLFAPKSALALFARDLGMRLSSIPLVAKAAVGSSLRDDLELPAYA
jgi:2-polyprenyl-6-methoxyphenol hydroxylase-like FAD-dependent oxidoreductase